MKVKHNRIKKINNRLFSLKDDNSGVAMIVALVVGVVVLVFTLSLLMVTYSLYAQMNRKTIALQCKLLAQNFSEVLGEELMDSDSDIAKYLSEQISSGVWISQEDSDFDIPPAGTVEELVLDMTGDSLGTYQIQVKFTYSVSEDEEELQPGEDEDDQLDDDVLGGQDGGNAVISDELGNGNYDIVAEICCYKGNLDGKDTQSFIVIVSEYRSVGL